MKTDTVTVDSNGIRWDGSDWNDVAHGGGKWLSSHNAVVNHRVASNRVNFLIAAKERPSFIDLWCSKYEWKLTLKVATCQIRVVG